MGRKRFAALRAAGGEIFPLSQSEAGFPPAYIYLRATGNKVLGLFAASAVQGRRRDGCRNNHEICCQERDKTEGGKKTVDDIAFPIPKSSGGGLLCYS